MKRQKYIKIAATICIAYDESIFGETTKAENRTLELEKTVRAVPGVEVAGWVVSKTSRGQ